MSVSGSPSNLIGIIDWSISPGLLIAANCGELPQLSETDADRSTAVPLLSAAESRPSYKIHAFGPICHEFYISN